MPVVLGVDTETGKQRWSYDVPRELRGAIQEQADATITRDLIVLSSICDSG